MKRRGSFDPSDYAFTALIRETGEILRAAEKPLELNELARLLSRASSLQGDARRAAFQIEGHEDNRERGWVLLAQQTLRVLKRIHVVEETPNGWAWTKEGPDPLYITYRGDKLPIYTPEGKATVEKDADRRLRLMPDPFTAHHVHADQPLVGENGNLPGRVFDPQHGETLELRQSLLSLGYIAQLPIIVDEKGVTLDGRTRERLCRELQAEFPDRDDLEPVRRVVELGDGPEANAARLKIALAANVGRRNLSTETKREVARYLYDERNWTYDQIAEALNVSKTTVQRMAAEGRAQRNTKPRSKRISEKPEWREVADPLINDMIDGKRTEAEVRWELKAQGVGGASYSTIIQRKAQLEAERETSSPKRSTADLFGEALEIEASETPDTPVVEASEGPSVIDELGYVISALEEHDGFMHLVERLRTVIARLDGSIVS